MIKPFKNKTSIVTMEDVNIVLFKYSIKHLVKSIESVNGCLTIVFNPNNKKNAYTVKQKRNIKNCKRYFKKHLSIALAYCFYKEY